MKKNGSNTFLKSPKILNKELKTDSLKVTEKTVELFYQKLSLPPKNELPVVGFKLFDHVEIQETVNAGV